MAKRIISTTVRDSEDKSAIIDYKSAIPYQQGKYNPTVTYVRNEISYPIVKYGELYYYLNLVGEHKLPAGQNPATDYALNGADATWVLADNFKVLMADIAFAEFAKMDSFVFNDGKMFSQEGTFDDGFTRDPSKPDYIQDGFIPNYEVEGISGRVKMKDAEVEGKITATSGLIGGMIIKDGNLISTIGKSYDGEEIVYGEYTQYQFNISTSSTIPTSSHETWTDLPSTTTASKYIQYKKNTETQWTQVRVGTTSGRWTVKYAEIPNASVWSTFTPTRIWMQIKVGGETEPRKAVKIDITSGYDFIPNITIDGVTGRAKIKDAEIEGTIKGSIFTSEDGKVVVDGKSNQIYLKDPDSDAIRTILSPRKLPLTPSSYFGSSSPTNKSLANLKRAYTLGHSAWVDLITIPSGDSSAYQITIPPITMSINVSYEGLGGGGTAVFANIGEMRLEIFNGGTRKYVVSVATVMSTGAPQSEFTTTQLRTFTIQGSGTWSVRATHVHIINTPPSSSSGNISNIDGNAVVAKVVNSSAIGSNGMIIATSGTEYTYMVGDTYEVRRGRTGFRITDAGVQKSSNMDSSYPTWNLV